MAKIQFNVGVAAEDITHRRKVDEIIPNDGASPTGSTFYKSAMGCAFEHALSNVYKIRPKRQNEAFGVGTIFHKALEVYYKFVLAFQQDLDAKGAPRDDYYYFGCQLEAQRAAWDTVSVFATEPGYTQTWEVVERIVTAYFEKYAGIDRWRILAVEETLRFTSEELDFSARLDLVIETEGRTWLVEHKTAKSISADGLDHYDMDLQTLGQNWLFQNCVDGAQLEPLAGCIVNIVTKHKTTQIFRKPVCPSRDHLAMFELAIRGWFLLRLEQERLGWPRSLGHCAGFARGYSKCQFFDVCRNWPTLTLEEIAANPPDGFHVIDTTGEEVGDV
jgi:hypothetical protein